MPDIDLDFPRDIREKLIVAVTERYGREHAALVASFATYRSRGAIRDVGKALGLPFAELERLARVTDGWNADQRRRGARAASPARTRGPRWDAFRELTREIAGLPRHISQHPGGMVISTRPLSSSSRCSPRRWPAGRSASGTRTRAPTPASSRSTCSGSGCSPRSRRRSTRSRACDGEPIDLSRVPLDDPEVYAEIQAADTVGVFQIESRAQMQSLLRTRPENLDDLTVQVALVRPGPIQGKAVHPYIEHRQRLREDPSLRSRRSSTSRCASRSRDTLGVVVFQDQVLDGRDGVGRVQRGGGRGAAPRDEPQAQRGGDRGVPAALRRGLPRQRDRRARRRTRSTTSSSASRASASRSRTRPRSRCSPTSRRGCGTTTRPSSSARS